MDQETLDRAVNIATKAAINGTPVARIVWMPPTAATCSPIGDFYVIYAEDLTASMTPPWEKD
jgi:hypothetical protein